MTVTFPEGQKAQGAISVTVIPLANLSSTSAPSVAEILADGVNISLYLITGSATPSAATNTGEAPRRLGSRNTLQEMGTTTHALGDFQYVYDPQAGAADPANAAKEMLVPGEEFYVIHRYGKAGESPLAVGDIVDIRHIQVGPQNKGATGDGEFDHLTVTQTAIAKAPPVEDVALVA